MHGWDSDYVLEALRNDIARLHQQYNLQPDLIFFTGDAAFGHLSSQVGWSISTQFDEAFLFIEELRNLFTPSVPAHNVFLVPGNHDVNRSEVTHAATAWLDSLLEGSHEDSLHQVTQIIQKADKNWQMYMERLNDYRNFLDGSGYTHLLQDRERLLYSAVRDIRGVKIGIAGLNSAWSCARNGEKGKLWLAGRWQIRKVSPDIRDTDIKICLIHHPQNWFNQIEDPRLTPDFERSFHFLLHGHEHQNWVNSFSVNHTRISAGACYGSSERESGYNFARVDLEQDTCEIWLRAYDDLGSGWIPRVINGRTTNDGIWTLKGIFGNKESLVINDAPLDDRKREKTLNIEVEDQQTREDAAESRGVFGRDKEIRYVSQALDEKQIVTIFGMSGIGKTEIIHEAHLDNPHRGKRYIRFRVYPGTKIEDIYRQIAPALGSREEDPQLPKKYGLIDFSTFVRFTAIPCIVHIDMAHLLFPELSRPNSDLKSLFDGIVRYFPDVKILLESRQSPPSNLFPDHLFKALRIRGLEISGVRSFFRRPFRNEPEKGWHISKDDADIIYRRLGGDKKNEHAHPLAMFLVAMVADAIALDPVTVLRKYEDVVASNLENELFADLYDQVLTRHEQHALRLCALYRDGIPDIHADSINHLAGSKQAFDELVRRCLLTPDEHQEWYYLHDIIGSLVRRRIDKDDEEYYVNHEGIAEAWLGRVKQSTRASLPNIRAASEAAYHLIEAQAYRRLAELADIEMFGHAIEYIESESHNLYKQKRFEDQRLILEFLVAIDPDNSKAHRYLGDAIEAVEGRGDEKALAHYIRAHELDPDFPNNLGCVGQCVLVRNEPEIFIRLVEELDEELFERAMDAYNISMYVACLSDAGRKQDASRVRQGEIKKGSRNLAFYHEEADYLIDQGQPEKALDILHAAQSYGITNDETKSLQNVIRRKINNVDPRSLSQE